MRYLLHLSYFSCKYGPFGKSREGEGEDTLGFINSNLEKDFKGSVRQLSFYLRNSLCMELFREFKFPFPKSLLKLLFLLLCKETSVYFMNLRTAVLEKHSVFCLPFKALSYSNYDIIWRKGKITRYRGLDLPFLASSAGKQVYQNLYQTVSLLKQSSDFLISAKGNICPSNNPWLILSSPQGLWYIQSRCFGIRP